MLRVGIEVHRHNQSHRCSSNFDRIHIQLTYPKHLLFECLYFVVSYFRDSRYLTQLQIQRLPLDLVYAIESKLLSPLECN